MKCCGPSPAFGAPTAALLADVISDHVALAHPELVEPKPAFGLPYAQAEVDERGYYVTCPECDKRFYAPSATAIEIAQRFAGVLRDWLTSDELAAVIAANKAELDPNVCHSHDFCDANEAMAYAFDSEVGLTVDHESDEGARLWSEAWQLALDLDFDVASIEDAATKGAGRAYARHYERSHDDYASACQWCVGAGCKSCGYTGRGDTHDADCDCDGCALTAGEQ